MQLAHLATWISYEFISINSSESRSMKFFFSLILVDSFFPSRRINLHRLVRNSKSLTGVFTALLFVPRIKLNIYVQVNCIHFKVLFMSVVVQVFSVVSFKDETFKLNADNNSGYNCIVATYSMLLWTLFEINNIKLIERWIFVNMIRNSSVWFLSTI